VRRRHRLCWQRSEEILEETQERRARLISMGENVDSGGEHAWCPPDHNHRWHIHRHTGHFYGSIVFASVASAFLTAFHAKAFNSGGTGEFQIRDQHGSLPSDQRTSNSYVHLTTTGERHPAYINNDGAVNQPPPLLT
jgi:hypothetical protein